MILQDGTESFNLSLGRDELIERLMMKNVGGKRKTFPDDRPKEPFVPGLGTVCSGVPVCGWACKAYECSCNALCDTGKGLCAIV